jgi:ABC-type sugar transport system permease subunit
MTAASIPASPAPRPWRRRLFAAGPYVLLAPGLLWLLYFFVWPAIQASDVKVS